MPKRNTHFTLFFLLLLMPFSCIFAQEKENDAEKDKIEQEIAQKIGTQNSRQDKINKYILKAKENNSRYELYNGYMLAVLNNSGKIEAKYADSLIDAAIKNKDNRLIASAYQSSGSTNIDNANYSKALDYLLLSLDYFDVNESKEWIYKTSFYIGKLKLLVGEEFGAKKEFTKVYDYFKWKYTTKKTIQIKKDYIRSLLFLIKANALLKQFDENDSLFKEAKLFLDKNEDTKSSLGYYYNALGFNNFQQNQFPEAIKNFNQALKEYRDDAKHLQDKFYLGMSYWKMKQPENALPYFTEIDQDYDETGRISMEYRPMFEFFMEYYKNRGNRDKHLEYVDKLLNYDRTFAIEQKDLKYKLETNYDEKQLLADKAKIESDRIKERWGFAGVVFFVLLGTTTYIINRIKIKQERRKLAEEKEAEENIISENFHQNPDEENLANSTENTVENQEKEEDFQNEELLENRSENDKIVETEENHFENQPENIVFETHTESEIKTAPEILENLHEEDDDVAYIPPPSQETNSEPDYSEYYPIHKITVIQILKKLEKWEEKKKYLKKNLRLLDIAKEFNTNDKYLARVIKTKTGMIFNHYVNDLRFRHLEELRENDPNFNKKSIKEIAKYLGYVASEPFINLFRERYGVSPALYFKGDPEIADEEKTEEGNLLEEKSEKDTSDENNGEESIENQ